jgi:hypothetical protein
LSRGRSRSKVDKPVMSLKEVAASAAKTTASVGKTTFVQCSKVEFKFLTLLFIVRSKPWRPTKSLTLASMRF